MRTRLNNWIVILSAATLALGQTRIDLQTQSTNIDFSGAESTKPFKVGATLPATCTAGQAYFLTTAPAGTNLYTCVAANMWSLQGQPAAPLPNTSGLLKGNGSGGASAAVSGTDYAPATSGSAVLKANGSGGFSPAVAGTDYAPAAHTHTYSDVSGTSRQGSGTKIQMFGGGTPAAGDCAKFDANGNVVSAGSACSSGGTGTVTFKSNNTTVASGNTIAVKAGTGVVPSLDGDGTNVNLQLDLDTSVAQTISGEQQSLARYCSTAGTSAAYTCDPQQAYTDAYITDPNKYYRTGSQIVVAFHTACSAGATITVSGAAGGPAKPVLTAAGAALTASDCPAMTAGGTRTLTYDESLAGGAWRLPAGSPASSASTSSATSGFNPLDPSYSVAAETWQFNTTFGRWGNRYVWNTSNTNCTVDWGAAESGHASTLAVTGTGNGFCFFEWILNERPLGKYPKWKRTLWIKTPDSLTNLGFTWIGWGAHYEDNVLGLRIDGTGSWYLRGRNAGATTDVDTGVALAAGTWYKLEIYSSDNNATVKAQVNGGTTVSLPGSAANVFASPITQEMLFAAGGSTGPWKISRHLFETWGN